MQNPWKVVVAFLAVFVAGAVFGGFFSLGIGARWMSMETPAAPVIPDRPVSAPAVRRPLLQEPANWRTPMLLRRYAERLNLTPEQKERIMPVFQRATEDYRRVQQTAFRDTAILLKRLAHDIAKELTPEQRRKLEQLEEKQAEQLRKIEQQREQRKAGNGARQKQGAASTAAESTPSTSPTTGSTTPPASAESSSTETGPGAAPSEPKR
jgi:hypothetical protein